MLTLSKSATHKNVMFDDMSVGQMVQANQHVIVDGDEAMLLDPGGHKVYSRLFASLAGVLPAGGLRHLFFSHQDPDIIAAANGWLMVTEARAYLSALWARFIPHFGLDDLLAARVTPIPDDGMRVEVGSSELVLVPAHFLHSPGNFQVYDPVSKILYTGDLGASIGASYSEVTDFDEHIAHMRGFHVRYMPSSKALKRWAAMARGLDVEILAPQHGAVMRGRDMVARFVDWVDTLPCGLDLMTDSINVP